MRQTDIQAIIKASEKKQSGEKLTVKEARLMAGYRGKEMANILKMTYQTYKRRENDPSTITMGEAEAFLGAVGLDFNDVDFLVNL